MSATLLYLLYADDGARLVYAGTDADEFERRSRELAAGHAGALTGRRRAGRGEQWLVRAYFRTPPTREFIAQRRRFPHDLTWEPADQARDAAAD